MADPTTDRFVGRGLPSDPDLPGVAGGRRRPSGSPFAVTSRRPRLRSRLRPDVLAAVAGGGALGGPARYLLNEALPTPARGFPWTTFWINVSGSFLLALLLVLVLELWPPTRYVRPFAAVGFLGAYTTFSTWMVDTAELFAHAQPHTAVADLFGSLLAGLSAVSFGLVAGRAFVAHATGGRRTRAERG